MSKISLGVLAAIVLCLPSITFAQSSSRGGGSSYRPSRTTARPSRPATSRPATRGSGTRSAPSSSRSFSPNNSTLLQGRSSYGGASRRPAAPSGGSGTTVLRSGSSGGSSGRMTSPGISSPVSFRDKTFKTREWWDNTQTYSLQARLVEVRPDRVVLVRDDGRQMSVEWRRLSAVDQKFVRQQIESKKNSI